MSCDTWTADLGRVHNYVNVGRVALGSGVVAQGLEEARIQRVHSKERGDIKSWRHHQ